MHRYDVVYVLSYTASGWSPRLVSCSACSTVPCTTSEYMKSDCSETTNRVCELCSVLHRSDSVDGTCGPCIAGYSGAETSNTACSALSNPNVQDPDEISWVLPAAGGGAVLLSAAAVFVCVHRKRKARGTSRTTNYGIKMQTTGTVLSVA